MSTPQAAKSPAATGLSANETTDAPIVSQSLEERKHEATLMAKLALRGHAVYRIVEGGYIVVFHGYVKRCADLVALEAFAVQVGGSGEL